MRSESSSQDNRGGWGVRVVRVRIVRVIGRGRRSTHEADETENLKHKVCRDRAQNPTN